MIRKSHSEQYYLLIIIIRDLFYVIYIYIYILFSTHLCVRVFQLVISKFRLNGTRIMNKIIMQ